MFIIRVGGVIASTTPDHVTNATEWWLQQESQDAVVFYVTLDGPAVPSSNDTVSDVYLRLLEQSVLQLMTPTIEDLVNVSILSLDQTVSVLRGIMWPSVRIVRHLNHK